MQCPTDQATLVMSERSGIEIDYCPQCRGVWLDRGELDKIIDRSLEQPAAAPAPAAATAPQPAYPAYEEPRYDRGPDPRYDQRHDQRHDQRYDKGYDRRYDKNYKRKRKESWLSELFD